MFGRRLVLLAPVDSQIDIDFTEALKARHLVGTTLLATWRRRPTTQADRLQFTVHLLPRLLDFGLDV